MFWLVLILCKINVAVCQITYFYLWLCCAENVFHLYPSKYLFYIINNAPLVYISMGYHIWKQFGWRTQDKKIGVLSNGVGSHKINVGNFLLWQPIPLAGATWYINSDIKLLNYICFLHQVKLWETLVGFHKTHLFLSIWCVS